MHPHGQPVTTAARAPIGESRGFTFPGKPALFLDRDGVINERIQDGYVLELEQLKILEPFLATFGGISTAWAGPIVIVSNQACVGKNLLDERGLRAIMRATVAALREEDIHIAAWYCCPHAPEEGCECRKPRPGLFVRGVAELGVRIDRSCFIGDLESDAQAGAAAGCSTYIVDAADQASFQAARAFADTVLRR